MVAFETGHVRLGVALQDELLQCMVVHAVQVQAPTAIQVQAVHASTETIRMCRSSGVWHWGPITSRLLSIRWVRCTICARSAGRGRRDVLGLSLVVLRLPIVPRLLILGCLDVVLRLPVLGGLPILRWLHVRRIRWWLVLGRRRLVTRRLLIPRRRRLLTVWSLRV